MWSLALGWLHHQWVPHQLYQRFQKLLWLLHQLPPLRGDAQDQLLFVRMIVDMVRPAVIEVASAFARRVLSWWITKSACSEGLLAHSHSRRWNCSQFMQFCGMWWLGRLHSYKTRDRCKPHLCNTYPHIVRLGMCISEMRGCQWCDFNYGWRYFLGCSPLMQLLVIWKHRFKRMGNLSW